jgi:hypothetical protein
MKMFVKFIPVVLISVLSYSSCTFGDKGKEKEPNTVDTSTHSSPEVEGATGNGVNPAPAVNTGRGTIMKDTVKTDSTPKSKMP